MAVDLLDGVERPRAAASAWVRAAFRPRFSDAVRPIVHTVCIIRDSVAVVELTRAKLTGAVAWAAFSGAGTYLLHIDDGKVEEKVFQEVLAGGLHGPRGLCEAVGALWLDSDAFGLSGAVFPQG